MIIKLCWNYSVNLHLILPLLVKFHQNWTRIDFGIMFWKNVVLYEIYNKKLRWPNTFYTSLYLYKLYIEIIKEGQATWQDAYKNKQITEKKWNLVIWYFWLSFFFKQFFLISTCFFLCSILCTMRWHICTYILCVIQLWFNYLFIIS